ncbi:PAS domain S-box protein [Chloroflexia bacterium SDU3-3]|nr:PAS domain S-box protein [Chloroflexia bacterium SDU3-3]
MEVSPDNRPSTPISAAALLLMLLSVALALGGMRDASIAAACGGAACVGILLWRSRRPASPSDLADLAAEGIVRYQGGCITEANQAMATLFGYPHDQLIGMPIQQLIAPENRAGTLAHLDRAYAQPYETSGLRHDGTQFPLELIVRQASQGQAISYAVCFRDISAHKLIEESLRSSEMRSRQVTEGMSDVIWVCNPDLSQCIYVNPAFSQVWGRSTSDLYERPSLLFESIYPLDLEQATPIESASDNTLYEGEYRIVRPDGSMRWIETQSFTARNSANEIYRIIGVAKDITRRKRAEAALHENEMAMRALYEIAASPNLTFAQRVEAFLKMGCEHFAMPTGIFSQIEGDQYRIVGSYSSEDGVALRPGDTLVTHEVYCSATISQVALVAIEHAGRSAWRDHPCYARYQTESYLGAPVVVHGQIYGTLCFSNQAPHTSHFSENQKDVLRLMAQWLSSEIERQESADTLKRQYRAVRRTQSELRAVFDATNDGMALISPEGWVLSTNRRFGELFANSREAESAQPGEILSISDFSARYATLAANQGQHFHEIIAQPGPPARELALTSMPVHSQEGYIGRLYVVRDVTDERAIDRMKSDFVAMVSHELRTPLTSIKGYIDILLEQELPDPMRREFLQIVSSNTDRLMALISDLLDVARIEEGAIELIFRRHQLSPIIRNVVNLLQPQIDAKQQKLLVDISSNLPSIRCDADRVIQILTNLISNAHKYTPAGGAITLQAWHSPEYIHISIIDNGIGIAKEDQARLFNKFFRAKNRAKQAVGTGLGLAISQRLAQMHGGSITVESMLDVGSTFTLMLPIHHGSQP